MPESYFGNFGTTVGSTAGFMGMCSTFITTTMRPTRQWTKEPDDDGTIVR